jgi:hypothetical protein
MGIRGRDRPERINEARARCVLKRKVREVSGNV